MAVGFGVAVGGSEVGVAVRVGGRGVGVQVRVGVVVGGSGVGVAVRFFPLDGNRGGYLSRFLAEIAKKLRTLALWTAHVALLKRSDV